ncbi:ribosome biogenesis GTP-binding protein YihA/YsxC [Candidatus Fokinia crypta]|uniref:Probable GTP-binding protein EngB n=1 Tax=Candidatus Fokinia crypta TaxID=1920990 RepID=A0ABZ0URN8_9RICK|nr:ribosome biogenesis GTP-binding protein YihA/YsxC [Candidatus Fokinia cryptica]WPX97679.1 Putative GTP-binding protein EngB [Candidatus Fokinia cryptica]
MISDNLNYNNANFVCGTTSVNYALKQIQYPEIAIWGRSNVGKSSIINALTERRGLCRRSMKPGCTMQLNYFLIDNKLMIVDMPGYGFAKRSKSDIRKNHNISRNYITSSTSLKALLLLVDVRHGCKESDIEMIKFLCENGRNFLIVFTKADKVSFVHAASYLSSTFPNILADNFLDSSIAESAIITSSKLGTNISMLKKLITEAI